MLAAEIQAKCAPRPPTSVSAAASPLVMSSIRSCRAASVAQAAIRTESPVAVSIWK